MRDYVLIVTAGNNDGIRAVPGKKRKMLISDEVDKFSNAFFGGQQNTDWYLDPRRLEGGVLTLAKPTISGCDAHSFEQMDAKLGKVFFEGGILTHAPTWIKADVTFEGLKQIVFEPESRVWIGDEPDVLCRVRQHGTKYIDSLHLSRQPGYAGRWGTWFDQEQIALNSELVAIIGNKGGGKSAIADAIGLLGNSHNQQSHPKEGKPEELFSFLNREKFLKGGCADSFVGELRWIAGDPSPGNLGARVDENIDERVKYLPQKYLEKICADVDHDEFRATLDEVVFRYVEIEQRYKQTTFADLIAYLTRQSDRGIGEAKLQLNNANKAVVAVERKLTDEYHREIDQRLALKRQEIAALKAPAVVAEPVEASPAETADRARLTEIATKLASLEHALTSLRGERVELKMLEVDSRRVAFPAIEDQDKSD